MKAVGEDVLMDAFVRIFNGLQETKGTFIKTLKQNMEAILNIRDDEKQSDELESRIEELKKKNAETDTDPT